MVEDEDLRNWRERQLELASLFTLPLVYPHPVESLQGTSQTRFPLKSKVSCQNWVSELFFYPLSHVLCLLIKEGGICPEDACGTK
jgi:hypothetical protein